MGSFPVPGDRFGRYTVRRVLGQGGMGIVYEAYDDRLDRSVALKVLAPQLAGEPAFVRRFEREASVLARVRSRGIVSIHEYGEHEGTIYLVTDYFQDGDLHDWLTRHGPLDARRALALVIDVTEALDDAHRAGVVHRDIKTSNILVWRRNDRLVGYLCDFGIAGQQGSDLTSSGTVMGSLSTMAPELHDGVPADHRSDLYAVGCVLWASLTGRPPYVGSPPQLVHAHLSAPLPQLAERGPFERQVNHLVRVTMAKAPADRVADARTLLGGLRRALEQAPAAVLGPAPGAAPETAAVPPPDSGSRRPVPLTPVPPVPSAPTDVGSGHAETVAARATRPPPPPPPEVSSGPRLVRTEGPAKPRRGRLRVVLALLAVGVLAAAFGGAGWAYATGRLGVGPLSADEQQAAGALADGVGIEWAEPGALDCAAEELASDLRLGGLQDAGVVDADLGYQADGWTASTATDFHRHLLECSADWPVTLSEQWEYGDHAAACLEDQGADDVAEILAEDLADTAPPHDVQEELTDCIRPPVSGVTVAGEGHLSAELSIDEPLGPVTEVKEYRVSVEGGVREESGDPHLDIALPDNSVHDATVVPYFDGPDGTLVPGDPVRVQDIDPWPAPRPPSGTYTAGYRSVELFLEPGGSSEASAVRVQYRTRQGLWRSVRRSVTVRTPAGGVEGCVDVRTLASNGGDEQTSLERELCGVSKPPRAWWTRNATCNGRYLPPASVSGCSQYTFHLEGFRSYQDVRVTWTENGACNDGGCVDVLTTGSNGRATWLWQFSAGYSPNTFAGAGGGVSAAVSPP